MNQSNRSVSQTTKNVIRRCTIMKEPVVKSLAGIEGFEPSNVGIKNQCLNHLAIFQNKPDFLKQNLLKSNR